MSGTLMSSTLVPNANASSVADAQTGGQCQNLIVPGYFYPGPDWTRVEHARPVPRIMIMDAAGPGAGSSPQPDYQSAVRQARAAGITIVGYSDTDYGRRPASAVMADIRNYKAWYGVTSIFLDQVSSSGNELPYYRELARYIHRANHGSTVILNPGTYPDQRYMSVGDIVVVFENTYAAYAHLQVPSWVVRYPAGRFAQIVYATRAPQLTGTFALAAHRHAGYVYVTDGRGPQRYATLPSYWANEVMLALRCTGGKANSVQGKRP